MLMGKYFQAVLYMYLRLTFVAEIIVVYMYCRNCSYDKIFITDNVSNCSCSAIIKGELRGKNEAILHDWPIFSIPIFDNNYC